MPQPRKVSDANRELESCDERVQVYLVDVKDATEEHRNDPHVIITNSSEESWDATEINGIKSIYALRGKRGGTDGMQQSIKFLCIEILSSIYFISYCRK
jgi:hypothetical protein